MIQPKRREADFAMSTDMYSLFLNTQSTYSDIMLQNNSSISLWLYPTYDRCSFHFFITLLLLSYIKS